MADSLEYLEGKQPEVGNKPSRTHYSWWLGLSHFSEGLGDLGRPMTLLGFWVLSLDTQKPNPIAGCCFLPLQLLWGEMCSI